MSMLRAVLGTAVLLLAGCSHHNVPTLTQAVESGDLASMHTLLAQGANPDQTDGRGLTALIVAARNGSVEAVQALIRHHADPNLRGGVNDWTPLMHAVHKNQTETARALLDGGAEVDSRGHGGETPLMMAAGYGYTPLVELLLDRGADPRAAAADGSNVLSAALGGVPDVERFTLASCQAETVHVLKRRYPDLHLPDNLWARVAQMAGGVAKLRGCSY